MNQHAQGRLAVIAGNGHFPFLVVEAARDLKLNLPGSWFVGDKASDVQCGRAAGVRPILVLTGHGAVNDGDGAVFVAKDFLSAAEYILEATQ